MGESTADAVEVVQSAFTSVNWVAQQSSVNLSEPFSWPVKVGSTWEMMHTYNAGLNQILMYSCQRDPNIAFNFTLGQPRNDGDTSGIFVSSSANSNKAYMFALLPGETGIRYYRTADPCPAGGCSPSCPSFGVFNLTMPSFTSNSIDYPYGFYDDVNNNIWISFNGNRVANGQTTLGLIKLNANDTASNFVFTCNTNSNQFANGAVDSNGDVHLIYLDNTVQKVRTVKFSRTTNSFDCSSVKDIGPHTYSPNNCGTNCTTTPTLAGVGDGCLRDTFNPSIAIDRSVTPNNLVASYHTIGDANCPTKAETRMYRSTDLGLTWPTVNITLCQTSVKPRVATAFTPTVTAITNSFQVHTTHNVNGNQVAQVNWSSLNNSTFFGAFMTGGRAITNNLGGCYWGDYDGSIADLAHNNRFFFSWEQTGDSFGLMGIQGATNP
jgi:hypothetical protein